MRRNLQIIYSNSCKVKNVEATEIITFEELVRLAKSKEFLNYIHKYRDVEFYCSSFTAFAKPFLTACICWLLKTRKCVWINSEGKTKEINVLELFRLFGIFIVENMSYKTMVKKVNDEIDYLLNLPKLEKKLDMSGCSVYLRCDLVYGFIAGGSLGHIAGVVNNLKKITGKAPLFISTDYIPTVKKEVPHIIVNDEVKYANVKDIAGIAYNDAIYNTLVRELDSKKVALIYQRSALNGYAGIKYAIEHDIPFILEYNGSEIWISNKWGGKKLNAVEVSEKIERLTFEKADLITCVSNPLKEQLIKMGIDEKKIIVTPNSVDPEMYRPDIDGNLLRKIFGVDESKIVIGFIGTFGAWHGVDKLMQAYVNILRDENMKKKTHLLLVGDGTKMQEVKQIIAHNHIENNCTLTGIVPQEEGPNYLASCDILVSPTIKNPDGTPFFGSPTKLFEYMAMGKAIVCSNMDQMGEILDDGENALLCEPGDVIDLQNALARLIEDEVLRKKLGENARELVCSKYTWELHTKHIIDSLKARLDSIDE